MSYTMGTSKSEEVTELDRRTARLREQLSSKPSLFDVFSAKGATPRAPNDDCKLRSCIRGGKWLSYIVMAYGVLAIVEGFQLRPSHTALNLLGVSLVSIGLVSVNILTALGLLRARIIALEAQQKDRQEAAEEHE